MNSLQTAPDALATSLKKMVIEECNCKGVLPEQIGNDESIMAGTGVLKLDSLDAVEIVAALERNFAIRLENAGDSRKVFKSFRVMSDFVSANASQESVHNFIFRHTAQHTVKHMAEPSVDELGGRTP